MSTLQDDRIQVGNVLYTSGTFTNARDNYNPIDPDDVFLTYLKPDGSETQHQYGDPDLIIVRDDIGVYSANIPIDQEGIWHFRWWSTGNATASTEVCIRAIGYAA